MHCSKILPLNLTSLRLSVFERDGHWLCETHIICRLNDDRYAHIPTQIEGEDKVVSDL
jgi:hypothetical protein